MRVTRGLSTAGQVSGSGAFTRSQVFAPSVERKIAGGRVPARIRSGSCGERATDQMQRPSISEGRWVHWPLGISSR